MTLSIWDCITYYNTLTNLGITQGSYLWTSARPSIPSCLTFSQTNSHSSLCPYICQWITSFLTDRQQLVRLSKLTSRTLIISAPQGCVLSPLLFSLYTNDCTSKGPSIKLLKFADGTTVIGLIKDGDESSYRQEVEQLTVWCSLNNLELNTLKTVEMIVDFRRNPPALPPQPPSLRTWSGTITLMKRTSRGCISSAS